MSGAEQQFNPLEQEIQELETRLREKKEAFEQGNEQKPEKEVFKETFREHFDKQIKATPSPAAPTTQNAPAPQVKAPPHEPEKEPEVSRLVEIALGKGIAEAVEEAKKTENPHILDDLHDTLVDHYYNELIKRGIIK
jgi:hypothetical protein